MPLRELRHVDVLPINDEVPQATHVALPQGRSPQYGRDAPEVLIQISRQNLAVSVLSLLAIGGEGGSEAADEERTAKLEFVLFAYRWKKIKIRLASGEIASQISSLFELAKILGLKGRQ